MVREGIRELIQGENDMEVVGEAGDGAEAIELVSQARESFGLDANLKVNGMRQRLTKEEEILIYRIIQEAVRNVWKHAEATKVDVAIEFGDGKTSVMVSDNGKGFKQQEGLELAKTGKLGLIGMQERARLLGGTLEIKSELGKGTQVIAGLTLNS